MTITQRFYEIIVRNNLDKPYPAFRSYLRALELIEGLRASYSSEKDLLLVGVCETDFDMFAVDFHSTGTVKQVLLASGALYELKADQFDENAEIMVVSYDFRDEICSELSLLGRSYLDLYDYFAENGLFFERDYYKVFPEAMHHCGNLSLSHDYRNFDAKYIAFHLIKKYAYATQDMFASYLLQKIIFCFLWMKDIVSAKKYIQIYIDKKYTANVAYKAAVNEIDVLLDDIKIQLQKRDNQDVFMFLLDALDYGCDEELTFLKKHEAQALVFENMFTVTPYTQATLKTLFCKKRIVDDKSYQITKINSSNSPFLRLLIKNNLEFNYYGARPGYFDDRLVCKKNIYTYEAFSSVCWTLLEHLLSAKRPYYCLLHELIETHPPYTCADSDASHYFSSMGLTIGAKHPEEQRKASLVVLNKQLEFYNEFLPKNCLKIFMSDHGHIKNLGVHTIFHVSGKGIIPERRKALTSYIDFTHLIEEIIFNNVKNVDSDQSLYVKIQDADYYYGGHLAKQIREREVQHLIGYQGIVTESLGYQRNNWGKEMVWGIDNLTKESVDILLERARALCGTSKIDVEQDEKFKYSKYLYRIRDRYFARGGSVFEEKKMNLIRNLIPMDGSQVWAIRGGGRATA